MRPHIKERYECSQWMEFGGGRSVALVSLVKRRQGRRTPKALAAKYEVSLGLSARVC
jgi:hypothetical protein